MRARLEAIREPKNGRTTQHEPYIYPFAIGDGSKWAFRWQHPGEFLEINFK